MARRLLVAVAGLVAVAAAVLLLSDHSWTRPVPPKPPLTAVEVTPVAAPRGDEPVVATGALRWRREMTLSFRVPGVITRLAVDDGDDVRQGQVIAALDPATVDARLRQVSTDLARARREADRLAPLVQTGAVSRQQFETQAAAVADARAAYDAAAFDRRGATLVAPASGVILARTAQAGEVVQPGQAVVTLADETSPLVLRAPLSDREVGRVALGAAARVTLDALPGAVLTGSVSRIGQQAGAQSGAIEIEVTVPAQPGLRSGLIARAEIAATPGAGAAAAQAGFSRVPAEAVLEADGERAFVLRFDPQTQTARRTQVRFGGFDGDDALVAGLAPGALLITAGAGYVGDGQTVSVTDPSRLTDGGVGLRR